MNFLKIKIKLPFKKKKHSENKKKIKKKKSEKKDEFSAFQNFLAILQAFYDTSISIRKTIIVEKLDFDALFGSTDAAFTGMAVGFAYAEIYKLIGFLSTIFTVKKPNFTIKPVFNDESVFDIGGEGIIKTKAAHIISTAIKFYFNYKKAIK